MLGNAFMYKPYFSEVATALVAFMLYSAHIKKDAEFLHDIKITLTTMPLKGVRVAVSKVHTRDDSEIIKYLTMRIYNFLEYLCGFWINTEFLMWLKH